MPKRVYQMKKKREVINRGTMHEGMSPCGQFRVCYPETISSLPIYCNSFEDQLSSAWTVGSGFSNELQRLYFDIWHHIIIYTSYHIDGLVQDCSKLQCVSNGSTSVFTKLSTSRCLNIILYKFSVIRVCLRWSDCFTVTIIYQVTCFFSTLSEYDKNVF